MCLTQSSTPRLTHTGKAAHFRVRISCPTPQGLKAIARRGQTAQEVFFTVRIQFDSIRVEPIVMVVVFGGSVSRLCWRCACAVR